MSLLQDLMGQMAGAAAGLPASSHADLAHAVLDMLGNQQTGGLAGLAQTFEQKGLGSLMSSWVGTGANQAITPDQISHVLGGAQLQQLSQKTGIPPAVVASALTTLLPTLVDKLTPNGTVQHSLLQDGIALLRTQLAQQPA